MSSRRRKWVAGTAALLLVVAAILYWRSDARVVGRLAAKNIEARGGAKAWEEVSALRLTGQMDVGQGMRVPYVLEQKRPDKMRLEFVFQDRTAIQCTDGKSGWKVLPFQGRTTPEPMTEEELREMADTADPYGLLYDRRGKVVEPLGEVSVEGREARKLKVTLPRGAVRWVYVDAETGLEIKIEAERTIRGRKRRVATYYDDWKPVQGLLIARRQETRTEGEDKVHVLTVETVRVNPTIDDSRFAMPSAVP